MDLPSCFTFFQKLLEEHGPKEDQYPLVDSSLDQLHHAWKTGVVSPLEVQRFRDLLQPTLTLETMQGLALLKPHGYPGDYEILDKIYYQHITTNPLLKRWDHFFQRQAAAKAVRNRKNYFQQLLTRLYATKSPQQVLKVGIGPGRGMAEWLQLHPQSNLHFDCVEIDPDAIIYAKQLNERFLNQITFIQCNPRRYHPTKLYDLIWIAGLFDYCEPMVFVRELKKFYTTLAADGQLVIGNFSQQNPSQSYMEVIGDWHLLQRTSEELIHLARLADIPRSNIQIQSEAEGVNLFLHLFRDSVDPKDF